MGLSPGVNLNDIKTAYRQLSKKHHPDISTDTDKSSATEKFQKIQDAYQWLQDNQELLPLLSQPSTSPFRAIHKRIYRWTRFFLGIHFFLTLTVIINIFMNYNNCIFFPEIKTNLSHTLHQFDHLVNKYKNLFNQAYHSPLNRSDISLYSDFSFQNQDNTTKKMIQVAIKRINKEQIQLVSHFKESFPDEIKTLFRNTLSDISSIHNKDDLLNIEKSFNQKMNQSIQPLLIKRLNLIKSQLQEEAIQYKNDYTALFTKNYLAPYPENFQNELNPILKKLNTIKKVPNTNTQLDALYQKMESHFNYILSNRTFIIWVALFCLALIPWILALAVKAQNEEQFIKNLEKYRKIFDLYRKKIIN